METVGFIGLGNMGSRMAANVQRAGYPMVVHDVRPEAASDLAEAGASLAESPRDVAARSEVILTSLPGPAEVELVATGPDGLEGALRSGQVYIDLSTSRPTLIRELEARFRPLGVDVLDAPVSGGVPGAAARNLAVMVGGDRAVFERVRPILDAMGDKVFYAGAIGSGTVCKLVHNGIAMAVRQSIAEGMTLGVKAGVETEALWEAVRRGALGRMVILHEQLPRSVFAGDFDTVHFALELARKDVALAIDLAKEYDVPVPSFEQVQSVQDEGVRRGWGKRDNSTTFLIQEEAADVELRAPGVDAERASRFITTHPDA